MPVRRIVRGMDAAPEALRDEFTAFLRTGTRQLQRWSRATDAQ